MPRTATLPAVRTVAVRDERAAFDAKSAVSTISISNRELSSAPQFLAEPDLLRTLQLLPGVEAQNDYSAGLNVRGGEADQNLVLLDGYPIFNPFHLGGLFGTFIDPTVGHVELLTGGFPSSYGGRLSSVLDVRSAEETRSGLHGAAELSLVSSTVSLSGAMGDGNGNWMIAGRRTYIDAIANVIQRNGFPYHFQDFQAHLTRTLPGDIHLSLTAYDGADVLDVQSNPGSSQSASWSNVVLGATLSRTFADSPHFFGLPLGDSVRIEQRVSATHFDVDASVNGGTQTLRSPTRETHIAGAITTFGARRTQTIGYDLASDALAYSSNIDTPFAPVAVSGQRTSSVGAYYDNVWRVTSSLVVDAGLRVDAVSAAQFTALEPRLAIKYFLAPDLAVTAAYGQYAQWMRSLAREDVPIRALDFWAGSDSLAPVSQARDFIAGLERWLTPSRYVKIEAFYKVYSNLLEPNPLDDPAVQGDEFIRLRGLSYGADLMLREFSAGTFNGWVSYTYAVSTRTRPDGSTFYAAQDRRHDLNAVGSWRLARWTLGARFNFSTGTPYTSVVSAYDRRVYNPVTHRYTTITAGGETQYIDGPENGERLPIAHRLDLSAARTGHLFGLPLTTYVSVVNAYDAHNIFGYTFDYPSSTTSNAVPTRTTLPQFGVIPTVGVSIAW